MTSLWPSGAVVKVLACHAGGREFESPLEQFFFFFFFFFLNIFLSSFHLQTSFFCISLLLFFLSAQFRIFLLLLFFQIDLHVISFSNLYKLNNLLISQLLILSMNYC